MYQAAWIYQPDIFYLLGDGYCRSDTKFTQVAALIMVVCISLEVCLAWFVSKGRCHEGCLDEVPPV